MEPRTIEPTSGAIPTAVGGYRWLVCALLFLATTINYIDRQILALLKPVLDDTLHWTNEQFGQVNSAFQAAYAVGLLAFGAFVARFGSRIGYAVSITAWSAAAVAHAAVGSIGGFALVRVALGLGEGGNFPASISAVALWFPRDERALATTLFNAGANVGAIIAPAIVPIIALRWGWQAPFVAMGLVGFAWLLLWIPLYGNPRRLMRVSKAELAHITKGQKAEPIYVKVRWRSILRYRQCWSFIVAKFMTDPVWWFFLIWLPGYFKSTRHLDLKNSWIHLVTIYAIVTVLSVAGGWLTGQLGRIGLGIGRARKLAMLIFACSVTPIFLVTRASPWGAVVLIGVAGAAHQAWSANLFTSVSDMFPQSAVAPVVGVGGMAGSLGGMIFPIFAGRVLDRFQAAGNITAGYALLFGICATAYLVAFAINHLLAPRFTPIDLLATSRR
jgi:MFS transporter, ACS family, hexuronate transporter